MFELWDWCDENSKLSLVTFVDRWQAILMKVCIGDVASVGILS